ncbi:hypothetical protein Syun_003860 [Stephania yunnanensis]|uniref:Uncharacterized protein n=1 Tax=Stephania yunnanensis TaxID=152371 RepID=A0AAP0L1Y2_9MAGN
MSDSQSEPSQWPPSPRARKATPFSLKLIGLLVLPLDFTLSASNSSDSQCIQRSDRISIQIFVIFVVDDAPIMFGSNSRLCFWDCEVETMFWRTCASKRVIGGGFGVQSLLRNQRLISVIVPLSKTLDEPLISPRVLLVIRSSRHDRANPPITMKKVLTLQL